MKKRLWLKIGIGVVVLFLAAVVFLGNYLVNFAIARKEGVNMEAIPASVTTQENQIELMDNRAVVREHRLAWQETAIPEAVEIVSDDGLTLRGDLFHIEESSHKWLLAVHGYTGNKSDMYGIASYYAEQGFHVLIPDMRSHGQSEGSFIGMGWLDRMDLLKWIDYIVQQDENAEIILHGVSMGGAAVMMVSAEELPQQVKGIVEDCGYTSVWDIFSDELSELFHLPDFPILYVANLIAKVRAGYDFKEASALHQVTESQVPVLFIHGAEDYFVRTDMVYELYEACRAPKDILVVENAGHGRSYMMDPELYFGTVFDFLERECFTS